MAKADLPRSTALVLIALIVALTFPDGMAQTAAPILAPACVTSESRLLVDARSELESVDPATDARITIPVAQPRSVIALEASGIVLVELAAGRWSVVSAIVESGTIPLPGLATWGIRLSQPLTEPPPRWEVTRAVTASGTDYWIRDRATRDVVLETSFRRRIELSASASSPDGRVFVHLQANNVASEVFIFDAMTLVQRSISIPHDARLAAFAISLTFSPDASCLAISMEREDDPHPDTWIVDLTSSSPTPEQADLGYVLAWIALDE